MYKQSPRNIQRLLKKAREKNEDKKLREVWLAKFPHMTKENFISFEDFKKNKGSIQVNETNETVKDTFNRFKKLAKGSEKDESN